MAKFKVPIFYERYGYLPVEADSEEEAYKKAARKVETMTLEEMDRYVDYLPDSAGADPDGIMCEG